MHHRQDLISRLQDEIGAWDQELATADDGHGMDLVCLACYDGDKAEHGILSLAYDRMSVTVP
jgi:hypothetical protein